MEIINALLLIIVAIIVIYFIYQNNRLVNKVISLASSKEAGTPLQAAVEVKSVPVVKNELIEQTKEDEAAEEDLEGSDAEGDTEDVYAAIAMALYELQNDSAHHDWEETVLTIDKVKKDYSPWSSKIYGLRETPVLRKR